MSWEKDCRGGCFHQNITARLVCDQNTTHSHAPDLLGNKTTDYIGKITFDLLHLGKSRSLQRWEDPHFQSKKDWADSYWPLFYVMRFF